MLVGKMPVEFASKSGITAKSEVPIDIKIVVRLVLTKISGGIRIPPIPVHSPLVVIEVVRILSSNRGQRSQRETEKDGDENCS